MAWAKLLYKMEEYKRFFLTGKEEKCYSHIK